MTQLLALCAALALVLANNVAFMMLGWGLRPSSWLALVGFGIVGSLLSATLLRSVLADFHRK